MEEITLSISVFRNSLAFLAVSSDLNPKSLNLGSRIVAINKYRSDEKELNLLSNIDERSDSATADVVESSVW